uniref:ATP synthase F0 subunit 8 n=1 Tax=Hylurgus ligniperda TaxID=167147 RepID=UPI002799B987|nr:ATP synthase F0 subunit 8 [Hylurgus ligniperda]WGL40347.1 ATP synthase F0 subunit 8 [Hylurgus ligniperda]WKD83320.1 ATP synthase F0 subunit 8 [Hylurgus ligniperda]
MPQMAPMLWMNLYMFFSALFFLMIINNYYMFTYQTSSKKTLANMKFITWKW